MYAEQFWREFKYVPVHTIYVSKREMFPPGASTSGDWHSIISDSLHHTTKQAKGMKGGGLTISAEVIDAGC